jgi:hypothetical protein
LIRICSQDNYLFGLHPEKSCQSCLNVFCPDLEAQLAEIEQKNLRSPVLLQKLGEDFGFGAAGKLGWARFELNFKQEQLDRFEA